MSVARKAAPADAAPAQRKARDRMQMARNFAIGCFRGRLVAKDQGTERQQGGTASADTCDCKIDRFELRLIAHEQILVDANPDHVEHARDRGIAHVKQVDVRSCKKNLFKLRIIHK